ncbi:MAG: hypothetical protein M1840_002312 [Geoglossum simile]|nr:MAG: hypothetical protein M1840_002312 [Geoglossum simile]
MSNGDQVQEGSRSDRVFAVTLALLVTSFFLVLARLFTRITILKRTSWDDYFISLAWLLAFGLSFAICFGTHRGLGKRDVDIRKEWQIALQFSEYFFSVFYNPALMATKTSILIFYLKLSEIQKLFRWASIVTLVVVNVGGVVLTLLNIVQCRPVSVTFKDPSLQAGKCMDIVTLYLCSSPLNIITDLAILFLPIPILTGLRLPRKQKNVLVLVFGLGGFVAVVDVVRIAYLQRAATQSLSQRIGGVHDTSRREVGQHDYFWNASLSFMWSAIEVNVGIICACIPTLKPLVCRYVPRIFHEGAVESSELRAKVETDFAGLRKALPEKLPGRPDKCQQVPPSADSNGDCERGAMAMLDFITTPDTKELPARENVSTYPKGSRTGTRGRPTPHRGFMNLEGPRSMVKMTNKESLPPLAQISLLFFLWGFAYGLLDVLNSQFQLIVRMSFGQAMGLHSAYFGAYFVAPLTFGRIVLKKWGFKVAFITGLCIYACGTLMFWPSAVLTSFPAFLVSNFIVGLGLSTLEIAANPFIALCGPPEHSELRINVAQGIQAVGSVISPILARRVLFKQILNASSLVDVQWTYLGIALFDIVLAVAFYYLPLPEASDVDLEEVARGRSPAGSARIGTIKVTFLTLGLGAFSQWCYVGGQETVSMAFSFVVKGLKPG